MAPLHHQYLGPTARRQFFVVLSTHQAMPPFPIPSRGKARYRLGTMQSAFPSLRPRFRMLVGLLAISFAFSSGQALAAKAKKTTKAPATQPGEGEDTEAPPVAAAPTTPPAGSSPMAELKKSNAALKKLFAKSAPTWSPEHDAKRAEMRKIVNGFLDFEELAHRALARHWEPLTPKQRTEFVAVLRDLIERNYIKQVHGQPNYELHFTKEAINGSEATVDATLETQNQGKKVTVEMEYKLLYKGNRWLVYDVITDEQSMLENYRAEFNKVISKESFDALLKKMKKRLEKTE
jgi:phospholipid transport system substrate-binding protein